MASQLSLRHVRAAQQILEEAEVESVVTGDIGLSYHGVDIVTHDVELCIPAAKRNRAIKALMAMTEDYEHLPDLLEPDFYHPYKYGAARFLMRKVSPPFELQLVVDSELGMQPSILGAAETGLVRDTVHRELEDLCEEVDDATLKTIRWPTLAAFTKGWLTLGVQHAQSEFVSLYLMQAERLIDANDVNIAWFEENISDSDCCRAAKALLEGKEGRQLGSTFD